MLDNPNQEQIWAGLKAGNKDALLQLYREFYVDLKNFALRLTGDAELSSDCITQCLLYLWEKRAQLPVVHNLRAYLLTCLRHQVYSAVRAQKRDRLRNNVIQHFYCDEPSYEDQLVERQTGTLARKKLAEALEALSAREKEMLRLRYFEDLTYQEIASRCGITKRTVYNTIHAAVKRLRVMLMPALGHTGAATLFLSSLLLPLCWITGAAAIFFTKVLNFVQ